MFDDEQRAVIKGIWSKYFPTEKLGPLDGANKDSRVSIVEQFYSFFVDARFEYLVKNVTWELETNVYFDVQELANALPFPDFVSILRTRPKEMIGCVGLSLSLVALQKDPTLFAQFDGPIAVFPCFQNLGEHTCYEALKSSCVGQLVAFKGYVVRVSPPKPLALGALFRCGGCSEDTWMAFEDGIYQTPTSCGTPNCRTKTLELRRSTASTTEYQKVKLQEIDDGTMEEHLTARVPRTQEVEVRGAGSLNKCKAGDVVEVVGLVKTAQKESFKGYGSKKRESGLHTLYVLANSIRNMRGTGGGGGKAKREEELPHTSAGTALTQTQDDTAGDTGVGNKRSRPLSVSGTAGVDNLGPGLGPGQGNIGAASSGGAVGGGADPHRISDANFTQAEIGQFLSLSKHPDCIGILIESLCPGIFGKESVKLGLLLGLMGGTAYAAAGTGTAGTKNGNGNGTTSTAGSRGSQRIAVRPDIHVLIVGDPGLGKSQLLRAAANVSPRSVVITGNTATTAGLTVAVTREGKNDMSLEAGALVLADRGVCCIDELDKMSCDPHSLLEAMEQQSISVAKAGTVTSIRCRTTVLAAANPVGGHYNKARTVSENLKLNLALLSRFDLVFIILDSPDVRTDKMISEHILRTRDLSFEPQASASAMLSVGMDIHTQAQEEERQMPLLQRLERQTQRAKDKVMSQDVLRRYVEYAKRNVRPRLSPRAAKVLQKMYLTMRSQASLGHSIPVTTRHLESLIRLASARAKLALRITVTEADAQDVVELLQGSLLDAYTNDIGEVDLSRKGGGGLLKQVKALVQYLTKESKKRNNNVFHSSDIKEACRALRLEKDPDTILETMHRECYLLSKGSRMWELNC